MSVSLIIVKDTFSPKLKEIETQLGSISLRAVEKARDVYIPLQTPLVPLKSGRLLSSMNKTNLMSFGESVELQFGFFATDPETGESYAHVQEEFYPNKIVRYTGHTPTINYFYQGVNKSKPKMLKAIKDEFKLILI